MSKMIKVNLLSPERKEVSGAAPEGAPFQEEEKTSKINTGAIVGAAVITLGIIGYMYFTQSQALSEKELILQERTAKKKQLDDVLKNIEELENAKNQVDQKIKLIQGLKSTQQDTVKMMDALCDALPEWVWISNLSFSNRRLNLTGRAVNNNLISDFINNLKGTGSFDNIEFPGSDRATQTGQEIFNFRITCTYKVKDKDVEKKSDNKEKQKAG